MRNLPTHGPIVVVALILAFVAGCGQGARTESPLSAAPASPPTASPTARPCTTPGSGEGHDRLGILVVGDSIAGGSTAPVGSKWWDAMTKVITKDHPGLTVSVTSIAMGGTGLEYAVQQVAATDLSADRVAIVIVGINDADDVFSLKTVFADDYRARYAQMLDRLETGGRQVIVATFPPSLTDQTLFFESYQTEMARLVREVAGDRLLDLWTVFHEMGPAKVRQLYTDNYHPNAVGQGIIGQLVAVELEARGVLPCP